MRFGIDDSLLAAARARIDRQAADELEAMEAELARSTRTLSDRVDVEDADTPAPAPDRARRLAHA